MQEQRQNPRYDVCWSLRVERAKAEVATGRTLNVSASGLLFVSPRRYEIGELAEVDLALDRASFIHCVVRIVREAHVAEGFYAYGVEFEQVAEQDHRHLRTALLSLLRRKLGEDQAPVPTAQAC